jgi:hypothetical protein
MKNCRDRSMTELYVGRSRKRSMCFKLETGKSAEFETIRSHGNLFRLIKCHVLCSGVGIPQYAAHGAMGCGF